MTKRRSAEFFVLASEWKVSMVVQPLVGIDVLRVFSPRETLVILVLEFASELISQKVQSGKDGGRFEAKFVERMDRLVDVECLFMIVEDFADEVIARFSESKKL